MQTPGTWLMGPFRVDVPNEQLWQGTEVIRLTSKAFAVLCYLLHHAGQLVTKDTLFDAVWFETSVSDAALTVCISELRRALGDQPRTPRFIETVHRRGYRLIAPVMRAEPPPVALQSHPSSDVAHLPPRPSARGPTPLIGREAELNQLHQWFVQALHGERQLGLITGEAGIGKTALVETFVAQVATREAVWIGYGQCIEQYGAGEAYMPLLEALARLCRGSTGPPLLDILQQYAPSWLLQMPGLLPAPDVEAMQRQASGSTRERMLRELAEAVEVITADQPLVLVLEDLHWSDASTLDWLAYVARRREAARLLMLGTYRPVEAIVRAHVLRAVTRELQVHGQCAELPLEYLPQAGVEAYLAHRFRASHLPSEFVQLVYQRTNGNPLFMVTVVEELVRQGVLQKRPGGWDLPGGLETIATVVPESLRQFIEQQFEQLTPADREMLEAASVAGMEFLAAAVAAGVATETDEIERRCAALARQRQFLQARGTSVWPDGTVVARYGFMHALYQEVLYDRLSAGRQVRLHRHIGICQEAAYGVRAREIAAELAMHFQHGQDLHRAVQYLCYAGENAERRHAHEAAMAHLTKGLEVLHTLSETPERDQRELELLLTLGPIVQFARGNGTPEYEHIYTRAYALCQHMGNSRQLLQVLRALRQMYSGRGQYQTAHRFGEEALALAQRLQDHTLLMQAYYSLGVPLYSLGEFAAARDHFAQALALYQMVPPPRVAVQGTRVASGVLMAHPLWYLGYPDQALQRSHEACAFGHEWSHPLLALALVYTAMLHRLRREPQAAQAWAEQGIALCTERGIAHYLTFSTIVRGWGLAMQGRGEEGLAQLQQGLTRAQEARAEMWRPLVLALLAETCGHLGQVDDGLAALQQAMEWVELTGERRDEAELYLLKGTLLQQATGGARQTAWTPEACFLKALDVARSQQAKALELRAATRLSRLWQQQGKREPAQQLLAEVYDWFTEGFDTADLQEAKALLEELR